VRLERPRADRSRRRMERPRALIAYSAVDPPRPSTS
jgi:hypothetical protein